MNILARSLSLFLLVSAGLFYAGCSGGDDPKSVEETQLDKLKATWTLQSADDGTDRTSEYPNMTVTFSGTFTTGGLYNYASDADSWPSVSPWNDIDTWKFEPGNETNTIIRQSDIQEMTYSLTNSDKTLTISFNYQGPGFSNGKVTGSWEFVFTRP